MAKVDEQEIPPGTKFSPIRHNEKGEEVLDTYKRQPPLGFKKQPSLYDQIRQQVRLAKILEDEAIAETEEEADDFEVGDDFEPLSKYENDHIPSVKELKAEAARLNEKIEQAKRKAAIEKYKKELAEKNPPPEKPPSVPAPEEVPQD